MFTVLRSLAWLFFSIVNDLIFAYNILMCLLWAISIFFCVWSWLVVYSLYIELKSLSKLEDLAQLRVSRKTLKRTFICVDRDFHEKCYAIFSDGNNGFSTCFDKSIISWISSNNAIHCINHSLNKYLHEMRN